MNKLGPVGTKLVGRWEYCDGAVRPDAVAKRIAQLTNGYLAKLANTNDGWDTLYMDPDDQRFWEHTYPESGSHGGGPPMLCEISSEAAHKKYRF